jgi:hypothetical protein
MIVAMSLSAAVTVRAQAPAGPNRPAQVPEEYVVTPFGYFHPSCVVHLAKGEELLEGGQKIQKPDGTIYTVPACEYPHYTARGEMFAPGSKIKPPTIVDSWIVSGSVNVSGAFGKVLANWNVPSAPLSYHGQTLYFFPGLQDMNDVVSILQPVLGWNSDFRQAWGIASWNCCPHGTADESTPVRVNTGDVIVGTVETTCSAGTQSCPKWNITTEDQSTGGSTKLLNTPSEGQIFNWAFGGVLEAYSVVQCGDYPPDNYITFSPTLYDSWFERIDNPFWQVNDWASGLTPQCDYGANTSPSQVTLTFGSFNLTVSTTGSGSVTSADGYINCPGNCMQTYQAATPVTLNASAAGGWVFTGWSGAGCSGTGTCSFAMTQNQMVSASFLPLYTLTVTTNGNGSVQSSDGFINCPGICTHVYLANTPVTLNTFPAQGWSLNSWSGACSGSNPTCTVTMSGNATAGATFTQDSYTLTASMSGQGSITSTDGFIHCPGACSHTYLSLTPVTLNASAAQGWDFSGWSGACTGTSPCYLTMLGNLGVSAYFMQPGSGLQFVPITPCRLIDTRASNGGGPIGGGTYRTFNLTQLAQTNGCADLSPATAYSLNVTLVPLNHAPVSYLTIWPAGLAQPVTSTMNSRDGRVKANAAIVPAGVGGVSVYVTNTTNLIVDIDGYFATPSSSTLKFYAITPCRIADTRSTDYPPGLGAPNLSAQVARDFPVLSSTCIPANVTPAAYSLNLTAIPYPQGGDPLGYLEVWPTGQQPQNPVSTLNNPTGTNVANAAIVPAGTDAKITAFANNATHLAIDIDGYFAVSGAGGLSLYPAPPCRAFDTRAIGQGQPFTGILQPPVDVVASVCAPPSNAEAYVFNATVIPSPTLNYLTLWPDSEGQPTVSTLNAGDGWITSNMAIVPNVDGNIDAYAQGLTQLILDISAYFAP